MRKITPSVILQITLILLVGFNFVAQAQVQDEGTLVPVGAVVAWAGASVDSSTGWLVADGSCISRTAYSQLYGLVGTLYGACDGSSTFAVPDLTGRVVVGVGCSLIDSCWDIANEFGSGSHTLSIAEMPPHTHSGVVVAGLQSPARAVVSSGGAQNVNLSGTSASTGGSGGVAQAFSLFQPSLALQYLIWTGAVGYDPAADIAITVVVVFPTHTPTPTPTPTLTPTSGPSQTPTFTPSPTGQSIYEIGVEVSGQDVLIRNEVTPGDAAIVGFLAVITILLVVTIVLWRLRQ